MNRAVTLFHLCAARIRAHAPFHGAVVRTLALVLCSLSFIGSVLSEDDVQVSQQDLDQSSSDELKFVSTWPGYVRGIPQAVVLKNKYLYCAMGSGGIAIYDLRDLFRLSRVGELYIPGQFTAERLAVDGDRAVTLDFEGNIAAIDLTDPSNPGRVATITRLISSHNIDIRGSTALILASSPPGFPARPQFEMWDLFAPEGPVMRSSLALTNAVHAFAFASSNAIIAAGPLGIFTYDCSDPGTIRPAGRLEKAISFTPPAHRRLAVRGSKALLSPGDVMAIDFSNLEFPRITHEALFGKDTTESTWSDDTVWGVVNGTLRRVHLDPPEPSQLEYRLPNRLVASDIVAGDESRLVTGTVESGLGFFDISDPSQPVLRTNITDFGNTTRLKIRRNRIYAADSLEVSVLTETNPASLKRIRQLPAESPKTRWMDLDLSGDLMVTTESGTTGRLLLWNVGNASLPEVIGRLPQGRMTNFPPFPQRARFIRDTDILVADSHYQVRKIGPQAFFLTEIWTLVLSTSGIPPGRIPVAGQSGTNAHGWAFAGNGQRLYSYNPYTAYPGDEITVPGTVRDIKSVGAYLYIACGSAGFMVVDASNPAEMRAVARVLTRTDAQAVTVSLPYAYVCTVGGGLEVFEIVDVTHPRLVATTQTHGEALDVEVRGSTIFVADGAAGISTWEFNPSRIPQQLILPGLYNRPTNSPPFAWNVTSSSGLPVMIRILGGPATLAGDRIQPRASSGRVFLRAEQAGDAVYAPTVAETFFDFTNPLADAFENWIYTYYPSISSTQRSAIRDPDHDGIPNETEHYLALDPSVPNDPPRLPVPRIEGPGDERVALVEFVVEANPVSPLDWRQKIAVASDLASGDWEQIPAEWFEDRGDRIVIRIPLKDRDTEKWSTARFIRIGSPQ